MRHWRRLVPVGTAVLAVLGFASVYRETTQPVELLWGLMGAVATAFSFQVARRRWAVNAWRKREGINGLFAISAHGSAILRTLGLVQAVLILLGGLASMTVPSSIRPELQANDVFTAATVIGLGAFVMFAAYYADRQAQQVLEYYQAHPDGDSAAGSVLAQADHAAVEKAAAAAEAIKAAAELHKEIEQ